MNKLFAFLCVLFFGVLLAYNPSTLDPTQALKGFLLSILFFVILSIFLLSKEKLRIWPLNRIQQLLLIYLLYLGFHYTFNHSEVNGIAEILRWSLVYLILITVPVMLKWNQEKKISLFINIVTVFTFLIPILTKVISLEAPFFNANLCSQILLFSTPFTLVAFKEKSKWQKAFTLYTVCASLFFIGLLNSLAVYFALVLNTIFAIYLLSNYKSSPYWIRYRKGIVSSFVVIALILGFLTSNHLRKEFNSESIQVRLELWELSIHGFLEKPILGHGLGSWPKLYSSYNKDLVYEPVLSQKNGLKNYQRPHNDFLWIAFEQGILGLLIYLALLFFTFRLCIINCRKRQHKYREFYIAGLLFFTSFFVFSLFSYPKERYEHLALFGLVAAIIIHLHEFPEITKSTKNQSILITFLLFLLASFLLLMETYRFYGETKFSKTVKSFGEKKWQQSIEFGEEAKKYNYSVGPNGIPVDWYIGIANYNLLNFNAARENLLIAHNNRPYQVHVCSDLGSTYSQLNMVDSAELYFQKALRIKDDYVEAKINLSVLFYNQGLIEKALKLMNSVDAKNKNQNYKSIYNAILEKKYAEIFRKKAIEHDRLSKLNNFIMNTANPYYNLLSEANKREIQLDSVFHLYVIKKEI